MINNYEDIINQSRPISKRPKMNRSDRAAQFAPFAALTGHKEAVHEKARIVEHKKILDNNQLDILNKKLQDALSMDCPLIKITYFIKDKLKDGGMYLTIEGNLKKVDEYNHLIILLDGTKISINDIYDITL